jgi:hypothetical protein
MDVRPEKYVNIVSESQAALKALQAAKTKSPVVQQRQNALKNISSRKKVKTLYENPAYMSIGRDFFSTQREARKLISGTSLDF